MSTGVASGCPTCGAPLRFGGAQSLVAVCAFCKSAVARRGIELASLGHVPDLVATDSRLSLGLHRKMGSHGYTVLGHVQLGRPDGDGALTGTWDEWYVALDKGGWGWLAEAQGRLFFTMPVEGAQPPVPFEHLAPAARFAVSTVGNVVVDEIGTARIAGAEGELPFEPALGATYRFADCSTADNQFVTLDYGVAGEEGGVYAGRELAWADAGLADLRPSLTERGPEGVALQCPACAHALTIKHRDTRSIVCPACGTIVEPGEAGGEAEILGHLQARGVPSIPLGAKGSIDGETAEVLGWIRRSTIVDGDVYFWEEYLLHGTSGYRWLTESNGHFHIVKPLPAGSVESSGSNVVVGGKTFKHFQSAQATYVTLQGEFYWRIDVGNAVQVVDFVAPPNILSAERDASEVNWSTGRWVSPDEIKAAFKVEKLPPVIGVGAAQPNPHKAASRSAWRTGGVALGALARLRTARVPSEVFHEDLQPVVTVSAELEGRDLGSVDRDVRRALAGLRVPRGYRMELGGQQASQREAFHNLAAVALGGTLLTLLVLLLQFRSLRPSLAVLATTPFAVAGALVTLSLTATPLNVSSLMGFVLLVGLEVKSGILLLEVAQEREAQGADAVTAVVEAGRRRIRPIMLTTTATLFGVLPLAFGVGAGTDVLKPLALAVLGGIALSKFLNLVALPSLAVAFGLGGRAR